MKTALRILTLCVLLLFAVAALAQMANDYLDIYQVQVKPEKRAEFDALAKKIAEANRTGGDHWEALETMYGDGNVVTYISQRKSYGDISKGSDAFMAAMKKTFGSATDKAFYDFGSYTTWSRGELRVRRWDLSVNAGSNDAERSKIIGQTRYLRTTVIQVRPGRAADFESMIRTWKAAHDKSGNGQVFFVSQSLAGQSGTVYYVTTLKPSLAAFDGLKSMREIMGDEDYDKWQKSAAEVIDHTSVVINRFVPEFSNVTTEIASAAPDFWTPKPMMPMKKGAKTVAAKEKEPKK